MIDEPESAAARSIPPEQVGAYWDALARELDGSAALSEFGTVTRNPGVVILRDMLERAHLTRLLELTPQSRLLDLGGGAGRIALWLAPRVATATLVDVSRELLRVAEREAQRRGITNLRIVHGSVLDYRAEAEHEAVLVLGVCCHLSDSELETMADTCARALAPGGRLYLKEPVTTDGSVRADERAQAGVPYRCHYRPRERYAELFGRKLRRLYQAPTCAHLVPWFLGGTEGAAEAAGSELGSRLLRGAAPHLVRLDPWLRAIEAQLRGSPALSRLLAEVPVLQDFYVFERAPLPRARGAEPELSVVVIGYNEELCVASVVRELSAALDRERIDHELVLVDDGSSDATLAQMQAVAQQDARARVVALPHNRGIGGALRAGFDAAAAPAVTWVPADGQIGPETVIELFRRRAQAPMITTVYRSRDDAWYRHAISGTLNRLIETGTGQRARSGGNYLFERSLWQQHAPRDDDSMMLSTAFRANLRAAGKRIDEIEIDARARVAGRSKVLNPRTILRTLHGLTKVRRR